MTHDEIVDILPKTFLGFSLTPNVSTFSKDGQVTGVIARDMSTPCATFRVSVHGLGPNGMAPSPEGRYSAEWLVDQGSVDCSATAFNMKDLETEMLKAMNSKLASVTLSHNAVNLAFSQFQKL